MKLNSHSAIRIFIAKLMIRLKLIKSFPVEIDNINKIISPQLPVTFDIPIPNGDGKLQVLKIALSLDKDTDSLVAKIFSKFSVKVHKTIIYNTHLSLILSSKIKYCKTNKTISPTNITIDFLAFVSDEDSIVQDTRKLIEGVLPEPLKSLFITSFLTTDVILNTIGINDFVKYLSLYLTGSRQCILDYHYPDIEKNIIDYMSSDFFTYRLNEEDIKEQLFIKYGKQVSMKNGELLFIFHLES